MTDEAITTVRPGLREVVENFRAFQQEVNAQTIHDAAFRKGMGDYAGLPGSFEVDDAAGEGMGVACDVAKEAAFRRYCAEHDMEFG